MPAMSAIHFGVSRPSRVPPPAASMIAFMVILGIPEVYFQSVRMRFVLGFRLCLRWR